MNESERHVEAVQAAIRILYCFDEDQGLRLADLHSATQFTKSRIIRLAGTLISEGFLTYDEKSSNYHLGPALFRMGKLMMPRYKNLADSIRPNLRNLVSDTNCTALYSVLNGLQRMVLAREEPSDALRYTASEGQTRSICVGASGRVMLAFGGENLWDNVKSSALYKDVDFSVLEERINVIKAKGYDVSISELSPHAFAVSVPVVRSSGELVGTISIAGPKMDFTEQIAKDYVELLTRQVNLLPVDALADM